MAEAESFRLLLTGDSTVTRRLPHSREPAAQQLRALIQGADVAFTNLEVLPNDFRGYPALESGGAHLAAPSWVVDEMLAMGFDLFSAANNHALDYSIEGLLATIDVLERKQIVFAGIGRNLAEARMPAYLDHPAGTIALVCCSSTFARGAEAAEQRPDVQGRPGLNPLHFATLHEVTSDQLATLRTISEELGLGYRQRRLIELGLGFAAGSDEILPFLENNFRAAPRPAVRTIARARDVEAIGMWVREARARAGLVVVSVHSHEFGSDGDPEESPAEFLQVFARQMIDTGADLIVCHGPHLLRGLELYQGKPIFYSLGNFVAQSELVYKLPADAYSGFRVDPSQTPSQIFRSRSRNDEKGFPADSRYWESVVPICRFVGTNDLEAIELMPIGLGHGEPVYQRGRPRLAQNHQGIAILERFAALSSPFGTRIEIGEGRAAVDLRC